MTKRQDAKRIKPHGYTKCPSCGYKGVKREDTRCFYCDCPFWPKAGHYSEPEKAKRAKGRT